MIRITYYGLSLLGNDPEYDAADTIDAAVIKARKRLKARGWDHAHALITDGARVCATVVHQRGRVLTKRAR